MATVTKFNGTTQPVVNIGDNITKSANAVAIATGIAGPIEAYNIQIVAGRLDTELGRGLDGTPGAVETMLNVISGNATILAYQVDIGATAANCQLSVITERSSWTAATLKTSLRALSANIGANGTVTTTTLDVRDVGIKLAATS
jgi:hypothetical protein